MSDGGQLSGRGQAPAEAHRPVSRAAATADLLALRAELARLREELATAEEQARAAADLDRLKEEFIAAASHELKPLLATLRGYSQLLLRRLQRPQPDLELLARLLDDLLDASRLQAGHFPLRTAPCDLGECLDSVLARLDPGDRERVRVQLPDAPVAGNWEGARIQQVLANLVGNALKYSPPETTVQVRVEWRDAHLQVGVIDSGMGIPPEELARLFQRFHRTPQAIASGLPGTGLGLYLCRGIIEAHGGRLWAASEGAGHGATFQFTLPRHASADAPRQADAERKESAR
jgi:signal transduction histidine kinase